MTTKRSAAASLALLAVIASTVSCGADDAPKQSPDRAVHGVTSTHGTPADVAALLADMRGRSGSRSVISVDRTLAEGLPNRRYSVAGSEPATVSSAVLRGTVIEAKPGAGYYVPGDELSPDAESGTAIDFFDKRALWRVIEVRMEVAEGVGADADSQVSFALTTSLLDPDQALRAAAALGEVAVVLGHPGQVQFNEELRTIGHWGSAFALVGSDGTLEFPTIEEQSVPAYVEDLTTWPALKAAAETEEPIMKTDQRFQRE